MKKIKILLLVSFTQSLPNSVFSQNVGIGTTTPVEKLEVKKALRSTVKISSSGFADTTEIILSNRNISNQGTDFSIKSKQEQGLFFSSLSDLPGNVSDNSFVIRPNGNLGVNNPAPNEKLDVNGNINVAGTIKVNGVDGTAGQVLMKNNSGNLAWGDLSEFKNFTSFVNGGLGQTWVVPTGVTKMFMEIWGAGGGGNNFAGGGGGGYACGTLTVTPGETITINVGFGGTEAAGTNAGDGGESRVTRGLIHLYAGGGWGAQVNFAGNGGGEYNTNAGSLLISFMGREGAAGTVTEEDFAESAAGTFVRKFKYGNGGDAGNAFGTGGKGGYRIVNASTGVQLLSYTPSFPSSPGGGGAGGLTGRPGAKGLVIIHY